MIKNYKLIYLILISAFCNNLNSMCQQAQSQLRSATRNGNSNPTLRNSILRTGRTSVTSTHVFNIPATSTSVFKLYQSNIASKDDYSQIHLAKHIDVLDKASKIREKERAASSLSCTPAYFFAIGVALSVPHLEGSLLNTIIISAAGGYYSFDIVNIPKYLRVMYMYGRYKKLCKAIKLPQDISLGLIAEDDSSILNSKEKMDKLLEQLKKKVI